MQLFLFIFQKCYSFQVHLNKFISRFTNTIRTVLQFEKNLYRKKRLDIRGCVLSVKTFTCKYWRPPLKTDDGGVVTGGQQVQYT